MECGCFDSIAFMDPVDRDMLKKVVELSEENNRMVHKLYRSWWWGRVWKSLYWVVIIGVAFGAFYFLQPYFDKIKGAVDGVRSPIETVKNAILGQ